MTTCQTVFSLGCPVASQLDDASWTLADNHATPPLCQLPSPARWSQFRIDSTVICIGCDRRICAISRQLVASGHPVTRAPGGSRFTFTHRETNHEVALFSCVVAARDGHLYLAARPSGEAAPPARRRTLRYQSNGLDSDRGRW